MKTIFLFSTNATSPGINIILKHLVVEFGKSGVSSEIIYDINVLKKDDIIIPYGIKAGYILLNQGYKLSYCLMVDAYSLGWLNKIIFYLKKRKIFYYDLYFSLYQIFKYTYKEYIVLKNSKKIMYVSNYDLNWVKSIFSKKQFILINNGVDLLIDYKPSNIKPKGIVLGSLSNWNKTSVDEIKWFIEDYFPKLKKEKPMLTLRLAGLGASQSIIDYFNSKDGIEYIGSVDDLNEFFSGIDIFIATLPKGVGVLNKILDSFAHRKLVIGLPECFNSFSDNKNGFIKCKDLNDYINAINLYSSESDNITQMIENSFNYVKENHNWNRNYKILAEDIIEHYVKDQN